MKAACLWLVLLFHSPTLTAQVTNISGIVNSYYRVIEVVPSKNCVRVTSTAGLSTVNKVMLVQMKGASINTASATSVNWGDTTSLATAGNYELAYICSLRGDSVFFVHTILNSYNHTSGKVQLVTVAEYDNAKVIDTLKASPWNNTTGTGGVIAIDIIDTLELYAPIYADGSGFQGGSHFLHSGTCDFFNPAGTAYAYDADVFGSSANGAHKGEGVADYLASVDGAKGAPANGGGGGNNHNNSGGGGANLNAGGRGGGNSSSGPFNCITANNQGLGGKALSNWNGTKIFLGGGGGAGHNNNAVFTFGGGNGGGIIFIHADTLISNGHSITANGATAGNSQGDGAGGGGAGGTLIMDVNTYLGAVTIKANGGNGGNSDDVLTPGRCFGGGGGGSGGVIYFKGATPTGTINVTAGSGGTESNRDAACNAAIPGLNGSNGATQINYSYRIGSVFGGSCGALLPAGIINFRASLERNKVTLAWTMLNPELVSSYKVEKLSQNGQWQVLVNINANDDQSSYNAFDLAPFEGENFYRIQVIEKNNSRFYSATRFVFVDSKNLFRVYPNPSKGKIKVVRSGNTISRLEVIDISGKILFETLLYQSITELQLPIVAKGVYIIRVDDKSQKLIID